MTTTELDQRYYGHGKLLISGEYFVMDGAKALAVPVSVGQSLTVKYRVSYDPLLYWKSYDSQGNLWLDTRFEFWHFNCLMENPPAEVLALQRVLRQARKQNQHFLRDNVDVHVETHLEFPREWGLGSSSTLVYNIAQWAYVSPFELLFNTYGGSGYDIACAQSQGPILYERKSSGPHWSMGYFDPPFKDQLFFVYLGKKQDTREGIEMYSRKRPFAPELITTLSTITEDMLHAHSVQEFDFLVEAHENIVSKALDLVRAKNLYFSDYWGEVKSLGAWGGDFVLVTSDRSVMETRNYFTAKGYRTFIPYCELLLSAAGNISHEGRHGYVH